MSLVFLRKVLTKSQWLALKPYPPYISVCFRAIFLETVAGVPGFSAGMIRHLQSLRKMRRDHGWIHTLIEEAENERMHLLTFIELKK